MSSLPPRHRHPCHEHDRLSGKKKPKMCPHCVCTLLLLLTYDAVRWFRRIVLQVPYAGRQSACSWRQRTASFCRNMGPRNRRLENLPRHAASRKCKRVCNGLPPPRRQSSRVRTCTYMYIYVYTHTYIHATLAVFCSPSIDARARTHARTYTLAGYASHWHFRCFFLCVFFFNVRGGRMLVRAAAALHVRTAARC